MIYLIPQRSKVADAQEAKATKEAEFEAGVRGAFFEICQKLQKRLSSDEEGALGDPAPFLAHGQRYPLEPSLVALLGEQHSQHSFGQQFLPKYLLELSCMRPGRLRVPRWEYRHADRRFFLWTCLHRPTLPSPVEKDLAFSLSCNHSRTRTLPRNAMQNEQIRAKLGQMSTIFKAATKEALEEISEEMRVRQTKHFILVFSMGSQFDHLIVQQLGKLGVFCVVADPASVKAEDVKKAAPAGIILSGGPASGAYDEPPPFDN